MKRGQEMKRLITGTHVLVADGAKALVLKNVGTAFEPVLEVMSRRVQENPPSRDQGADRPGRMADPGKGQRSAVADTDWHQLREDRFDKDAVRLLEDLARQEAPEHLVVVAPPRALGAIRKAMPKDLRARLVAEIDKDLTGLPLDKMARDIAAALEAMNG